MPDREPQSIVEGMVATRLILIEGMIGIGKTTMAARVARWLVERGEEARAYHEFADDHPIRTRAVDLLRHRAPGAGTPPPDLGADGEARDPAVYALDQWAGLAARCRVGRRITILESAFLQNSVLPVFMNGAPIEQVRTVFATIDAHIAPVNPLLVYLRPSDTADAVGRIHGERGEPWASRNTAAVSRSPWARARNLSGLEAVVALYRAWEPVVDELLGIYSSSKLLLVDPRDDWDRALASICSMVRAEDP